jgi:hypothetical protein
MCERLVLYQTVLSDTPEIRSVRLVLAEKQTLYQTVLSDTPEIRSLKQRLDRGEARALSFSKECQSLWLYLPINNHHASIPAQGITEWRVCVLTLNSLVRVLKIVHGIASGHVIVGMHCMTIRNLDGSLLAGRRVGSLDCMGLFLD